MSILLRRIRESYNHCISVVVKIYLCYCGVQVGEDLRAKSMPICRRHKRGRIVIASNVTIHNKPSENMAGISHRCVLVAEENASLTIGNNVGMSGVVLYCSNEIVIEDYVNLGVGVMVYDTDFHPIEAYARRIHDRTKIRSSPVRICKDAWIGAKSIILKGVTIGERSIVAAGSIVTRNVPPDTIAGGVPARIIRAIDQDILMNLAE